MTGRNGTGRDGQVGDKLYRQSFQRHGLQQTRFSQFLTLSRVEPALAELKPARISLRSNVFIRRARFSHFHRFSLVCFDSVQSTTTLKNICVRLVTHHVATQPYSIEFIHSWSIDVYVCNKLYLRLKTVRLQRENSGFRGFYPVFFLIFLYLDMSEYRLLLFGYFFVFLRTKNKVMIDQLTPSAESRRRCR